MQRNWGKVNLKSEFISISFNLIFLTLTLAKVWYFNPCFSTCRVPGGQQQAEKVQSGLEMFSPVFTRKCGMRERMLIRKIIQCLMQRNCPDYLAVFAAFLLLVSRPTHFPYEIKGYHVFLFLTSYECLLSSPLPNLFLIPNLITTFWGLILFSKYWMRVSNTRNKTHMFSWKTYVQGEEGWGCLATDR